MAAIRRSISPGQVTILAVHGDADNFGSQLAEFLYAITKGIELRRTHKGKVQWVKEQDLEFALKVS